ncbi:MAG: hypothetical protein SNJ78_07590 [Spirochaetales bacterium]
MRNNNPVYKLVTLFHRSFLGYQKFFLTLLKGVLFLGILGICTAFMVLPLWYFSMHFPQVYGISVIVILGIGILLPPTLRLYKSFTSRVNFPVSITLKKVFRRTGYILGILLCLVISLYLFQEGRKFLSLALLGMGIFFTGLGLHHLYETKK